MTPYSLWGRTWYTVERTEIWDEHGVRMSSGLVVPMYDRCAYYLYRRKEVDYLAHTITDVGDYVGGPFVYTASTNSTTPDGCGGACSGGFAETSGRLYLHPCAYTIDPDENEGVAAGYFKEWAKRCTEVFTTGLLGRAS